MLVASFLQESPEGVEKVGTSLQVKETLKKKFQQLFLGSHVGVHLLGCPHGAQSEGC